MLTVADMSRRLASFFKMTFGCMGVIQDCHKAHELLVCACVCVLCVHLCMHVYVSMCGVCACACVCVQMYVYMYVCVYVCMYASMYVCVRMYVTALCICHFGVCDCVCL